MRTLFLIRHSKATTKYSLIHDIDRPLNERGYRDSVSMSALLKKATGTPDIFISSPSVRTYATALSFARTFGYDISKIHLENRIYEGHTKDLLHVVNNKIDDSCKNVFLFGHNPGLERFIAFLTGSDPGHFATSSFAQINFNLDSWKLVSENSGNLAVIKSPVVNGI